MSCSRLTYPQHLWQIFVVLPGFKIFMMVASQTLFVLIATFISMVQGNLINQVHTLVTRQSSGQLIDPSTIPDKCKDTCLDLNKVSNGSCTALDCLCSDSFSKSVSGCLQCAVDIGQQNSFVLQAQTTYDNYANSCKDAGHPVPGFTFKLNGNRLTEPKPETPLQYSILELPQEIFEEISKHLDVTSVLSLRLACKHLLAVTSTTQLWQALARGLLRKPYMSKPEEPLHEYTQEELQDWVIHRYQADQLLRGPSEAAKFQATGLWKYSPGQIALLPGGRWLLFTDGSKNVFATDCDAQPLAKTSILVRHNIGVLSRGIGALNGSLYPRFQTWIDESEPRLSLKLAVVYTRFRHPDPGKFRLAQISRSH
ncbi:hypothetical protein AN958_03565 [Leucoagaricus sp. SymC.cos]|nr:hypothetical protein AN958_03565 [Leucoagaricus sp. SymC.cos]